jgi:branched-chain amino acid transport system ATP-binding protein
MEKETLLSLKDISVQYGGIKALDDVSVHLDSGEIVALMGPNGAGKSTILKALVGLAPVTHGTVLLHNQEIKPVPHEMTARGIAYVPQGRQVFKSLTVAENLELGGYALPNQKDVAINIAEVLNIFPTLKEKLHAKAGSLSGGQQQLLTIARGLVSDPRVILLDEPSLGLSPKIVKEVFALVKKINQERGIAVFVVEHSIKSILEIADRAYVLAHGKVALHKDKGEELKDAELERVFLTG